MPCHAIDAGSFVLAATPLEPSQVVSGAPVVAAATLDESAVAGLVEVGLWEHTPGTSTDVEADEMFVVVSGRATVTTDDGATLELRPGSVGFLEAGARTTWTVQETLRKVYVVRGSSESPEPLP